MTTSPNLIIKCLLVSLFLLPGCATQPVGSNPGTTRQQEYQQLRKRIVETHDQYLFGVDKPYLTEVAGYNAEIVPGLLSHFSDTYFNADIKGISLKCEMDPLVCGDARSLEFLFRESHNESVINSRESKLKIIEAWNQGRVSDAELSEALHQELKLSADKPVAILE